MNIALIVLAVIAVAFLLKTFSFNGKSLSARLGEQAYKAAAVEKSNDKLIVVSNVQYAEVRDTLKEFCKMYNKDDYRALPRLHQLPGNTCAVTFPYDIDMTTFSFAVNYLHWAKLPEHNARVLGWGIVTKTDEWISELANKNVMVYVDKADREYDNVSLTTEDNMAYFMPFTSCKAKALNTLPEVYRPRNTYKDDLKSLLYEDIR